MTSPHSTVVYATMNMPVCHTNACAKIWINSFPLDGMSSTYVGLVCRLDTVPHSIWLCFMFWCVQVCKIYFIQVSKFLLQLSIFGKKIDFFFEVIKPKLWGLGCPGFCGSAGYSSSRRLWDFCKVIYGWFNFPITLRLSNCLLHHNIAGHRAEKF